LNDEIVRVGLKDKSYDVIDVKSGVNFGNPVKLLIAELINFSEVDYDTNADLLHKLAKQAVYELETNMKEGEDIRKVVFQWRSLIANRVYNQMMQHFRLHEPEYIKPNVRAFTKIEDWNFTTLLNSGRKDYRDESFPAAQVPKYVFSGFEKSCHFEYKFDSRTEQTFAFILENDKDIIKWLRPAPNQFRIYWQHNNKIYEPDFIAETQDCIYMIEVKAANEMQDPEVQAKAAAAIKYCNYATGYTAEHGGKEWKYVLIPHDKVAKNGSFKGIVSQYIIK
jgi:type III restriction enzyme